MKIINYHLFYESESIEITKKYLVKTHNIPVGEEIYQNSQLVYSLGGCFD